MVFRAFKLFCASTDRENPNFIASFSLSSVWATPLISPDGRVHLKMEITDDFPDPAITSAEGEPSIRTRQAYTEVLVRDGETVVIGGILLLTATMHLVKITGKGHGHLAKALLVAE